jgi:copper chaperone
METTTLEAPDITCDHCIQSIQKAVTKLPSVQFISGDPESKRVTLEFDPTVVQLEAIEAAMEEDGYPVKK